MATPGRLTTAEVWVEGEGKEDMPCACAHAAGLANCVLLSWQQGSRQACIGSCGKRPPNRLLSPPGPSNLAGRRGDEQPRRRASTDAGTAGPARL